MAATLSVAVVTLFPDMFNMLNYGVVGRALEKGLLDLTLWNPRDYIPNPRRVDDRPYGGGAGMILQFEPLEKALEAAFQKVGRGKVVLLSPQGKSITQEILAKQVLETPLFLIAGRYEGVDERFIKLKVHEEWSVGDFVVSGGELPAMLVIDGLTRLLPGALHHPESIRDSFFEGLLAPPQYTRPETIAGEGVPEVLLSGDHEAISRWRLKQAIKRTWQRRQDLIQRRTLTLLERELLNEVLRENHHE